MILRIGFILAQSEQREAAERTVAGDEREPGDSEENYGPGAGV